LLDSSGVGFFYAPAMKISKRLEITIDGKLHPEHDLIPHVPWDKMRIGHRILFPGGGNDKAMSVAIVVETYSEFTDDRSLILTRLVADSNF